MPSVSESGSNGKPPAKKPPPKPKVMVAPPDDRDMEIIAPREEMRRAIKFTLDGGFPYDPIAADPVGLESVEGRTEAANGVRLVAKFGDVLRYAIEWSAWLAWDGKRWKRDAGDLQVQRMAISVATDIWRVVTELTEKKGDRSKADDFQAMALQKQLIPFATSTSKAQGIANMVKLARSHKGIPIQVGQLDLQPWLLNVKNGTLDLKTGRVRKHMQSDFLTKLCPTRYDPDAQCPTWLRFLHEVFQGDQEVVNFLQRILGYGLTGDVSEQMLPILWGEGSNGKSTLVDVALHVLGTDYGGAPPRELFILSRFGERHPTQLMTLQGKRLMMAQETDAGCQLNEALIKHLTGGDMVTARGMYENFSSFEPTHKLLLSTNHKPQVRGSEYATWRRLKLIPFLVKFEGERRDKGMKDKLKAEAEGILAWMVRGCLDWQRHGLQDPDSVLIATEAYKVEQDEVGQFIRDYCKVGDGLSCPSTALYKAFKEAMPDSEMTQTMFGRELTKRGYEDFRNSTTGHKARKGLELLTQSQVQTIIADIKLHGFQGLNG